MGITTDLGQIHKQKESVEEKINKIKEAFDEKSKFLSKELSKLGTKSNKQMEAIQDFKKEITLINTLRNYTFGYLEHDYEERVTASEVVKTIKKYVKKVTNDIELDKKLLESIYLKYKI